MFKNKQGGSFDSYDPSINSFDPSVGNNASGDSAGSTVVQAKVGQKMQFNVTLNNPTTKTLTFELFNYLNSYTRIQNAAYINATYLYIPLLTYEGLAAIAATHNGTVGFASNGDLKINGDAAAAEAVATIGCSEVGYSGLFEASAITPFKIDFFRYTCLTASQINKTITWFQKSFSGGTLENVISPRAYFKPTQFQNLTLDITVTLTIGIDKGIRTTLLPSENILLSFFVTMWTDQTIG
jgi:hypothetical protein